MRIAFIVGGFPRLSETFILVQVVGLLDLGHEVDIYSRRPPMEATVQPEVEQYQLLSRTRCVELPSTRAARIVRAATVFPRLLWCHPVGTFGCLRFKRYGSLYAVLNNLMFLRAFTDRRYDAILCHFGGNGIDFIGLKETFPRTRFITMFHGDDLQIGDELGVEVFSTLKAFGDAFLVTTDCYGRATLRRYGFPEEKIMTHRLGIPVHKVAYRERRVRDGTLRILTVGRLVPKKGIDLGIRAAVPLQAKNTHLRVEYRVVGDGPLRDDLNALVRSLQAERIVRMLGPLPSPDVMRQMDEADVYMLPSLMEQGGVVLLEAQASGLPVVASRVGGVSEMVRDGRSALLAPVGEWQGFADALQYLVDHPDEWSRMGQEGRRHVEAQHEIGPLNLRLESILRGS